MLWKKYAVDVKPLCTDVFLNRISDNEYFITFMYLEIINLAFYCIDKRVICKNNFRKMGKDNRYL